MNYLRIVPSREKQCEETQGERGLPQMLRKLLVTVKEEKSTDSGDCFMFFLVNFANIKGHGTKRQPE